MSDNAIIDGAVPIAMPTGACDCHTHVFGPEAVFPYWSGRGYTPPDASVEDLLELHRRLGIERVVIVHPSPYGTDNRVSIDAAMRIGLDRARVVAVIDPAEVTDDELRAISAQGVVGVRLNLASGGVRDIETARAMLRTTADRVGRLGWHVQVFTSIGIIDGMARDIDGLGVPVVVDHFGGAVAASGVGQAGFSILCGLVASGKVWVKLSAGYRISNDAAWSDADPLASALIAANADRCVWGTDWPHPGSHGPGTPPGAFVAPHHVDDAMALRTLWRWCGADADTFQRVLVTNPERLYGFETERNSARV